MVGLLLNDQHYRVVFRKGRMKRKPLKISKRLSQHGYGLKIRKPSRNYKFIQKDNNLLSRLWWRY